MSLIFCRIVAVVTVSDRPKAKFVLTPSALLFDCSLLNSFKLSQRYITVAYILHLFFHTQ